MILCEPNKRVASLHLKNFKQNLAKTLQSDWLRGLDVDPSSIQSSFVKSNKKSRRNINSKSVVSSTPCIPVKFNHAEYKRKASASRPRIEESSFEDYFYYISTQDVSHENREYYDANQSNYFQRVFYNSYTTTGSFIEPTSQIIETNKIDRVEESLSHSSSTISLLELSASSTTDSGLSSLNSAHLFLTEIKELLGSSSLSSNKFAFFDLSNSTRELERKNPDEPSSSSSSSNLDKLRIFSVSTRSIQSDSAFTMPNSSNYSIYRESANIELVEHLLRVKKEQENVSIDEIVDSEGNTLLNKAIVYHQLDMVKYLVKNYRSLISVKNKHGMYPIHLSVLNTVLINSSSNMPMLRLVCAESKKLLNKRDSLNSFTPAMYASLYGKYETLKYLLDNAGAKSHKVTKQERYTLLHLAVLSGNLEVVQYLLYKLGPACVKHRAKDGANVYHLAAARGHHHILEYLLALRQARLYKKVRDVNGSTPAHDAAENGHFKCLKLLYDAGLDLFEEDLEQVTPYDLVIASRNEECINFVRKLKPLFIETNEGPVNLTS